jgi:hypothetical protein
MTANAFIAIVPLLLGGYEIQPEIHVQVSSHVLMLGDPLYVKVVMKNTGDKKLDIPCTFRREAGTLRFELYDGEDMSFRFWPEGTAFGDTPEAPLAPGEEMVIYDYLLAPKIEYLDRPFWKPGEYELMAYIRIDGREIGSYSTTIRLRERPERELSLVKEVHRLKDRKEDYLDHRRPSLATFGLSSFPSRASSPEMLAALDAQLSPSNLRNAVRITRLAQRIEDAPNEDEQQRAIAALQTWLDGLPLLERESMSKQLVSFYMNNHKPELAEPFVSRMPDSEGCARDLRNRTLKSIRDQRGADKKAVKQ